VGYFLETAHPAKFTETVEKVVGKGQCFNALKLAEFMKGERKVVTGQRFSNIQRLSFKPD
jgi:threonine synthase